MASRLSFLLLFSYSVTLVLSVGWRDVSPQRQCLGTFLITMTWKVATGTHWGEAKVTNHPTMARTAPIPGFFKNICNSFIEIHNTSPI